MNLLAVTFRPLRALTRLLTGIRGLGARSQAPAARYTGHPGLAPMTSTYSSWAHSTTFSTASQVLRSIRLRWMEHLPKSHRSGGRTRTATPSSSGCRHGHAYDWSPWAREAARRGCAHQTKLSLSGWTCLSTKEAREGHRPHSPGNDSTSCGPPLNLDGFDRNALFRRFPAQDGVLLGPGGWG